MLGDLKKFLLRGNLVDLATAVIVGTAFTAVVTSLVKDVLTPLLAAIGGQPDFAKLHIDVGDSKIVYGAFLNALFNFVIVATVVFFILRFVERLMNLRRRDELDEVEETPEPTPEVLLLTEIRDSL